MRVSAATLLLAAFALLPAGCTRAPRADQITKLAVVQTICDPHCRSWGATLYPGDAADISESVPEDDLHTTLWHASFSLLTSWLVRTAYFTGRSDYRHDPDEADSTYITAWTGTTERQVVIPSLDSSLESDRSLQALKRFVSYVEHDVFAARYKAHTATRKRLANVSALVQVEYHANGCYGTCPAYSVRFNADNHASLENINPITREPSSARATVPFAAIVRLLQTSQFTELQTHYPIRAVDVFGARLHLRYRNGFTFDSSAPDSTQWSDAFSQLAARIDQVVVDTHWTPPLPPRR